MDMEKDTMLINYMDGSNAGKAFAAYIYLIVYLMYYIRYTIKFGKTHVALLAAKAKLNTVGGQITPRSEMDGHTLGARA